MKITVQKDGIQIDEKKITLPCTLSELQDCLGESESKQQTNDDGKVSIYHEWEQLGIMTWIDEKGNITDIRLFLKAWENHSAEHLFTGELFIEKKNYLDCKWKIDKFGYFCKLKKGVFSLEGTYFVSNEKHAELAKSETFEIPHTIDILYNEPKVKKSPNPHTDKYKLVKPDEPCLKFTNLNFKLLVAEELMYRQKVLTPKFDIDEFAEEYRRRKINVNEDGYEVIPEALSWFRRLPIPTRFAECVTELCLDGGNRIYTQIYPFWDGEDDTFDVTQISDKELAPFSHLKKVIVAMPLCEEVRERLRAKNIELVD